MNKILQYSNFITYSYTLVGIRKEDFLYSPEYLFS